MNAKVLSSLLDLATITYERDSAGTELKEDTGWAYGELSMMNID